MLFRTPAILGWIAAGIGLLCAALSSPGQSFALSFYLEPLMAELGMDRLGISALYSGATLAAAVALPLVGPLSWIFSCLTKGVISTTFRR